MLVEFLSALVYPHLAKLWVDRHYVGHNTDFSDFPVVVLFCSPSKYFSKDLVIHTITLLFLMGSDAVCFKPPWCGEEIREENTLHLLLSQQWESEPVRLTQGNSQLLLIKR